jgi:hypothetical protein
LQVSCAGFQLPPDLLQLSIALLESASSRVVDIAPFPTPDMMFQKDLADIKEDAACNHLDFCRESSANA